MRKAVQWFCGFAVIAAFFFSWLFTFTYVNRLTIHRDRDKYQPATFIVTGAEDSSDEHGTSWWLNGTVGASVERFVPSQRGIRNPRNAREALARYPKGSTIDVLFNPEATTMLVQRESLRILLATPDVWEEEARLRRKLARFVLIPVPVASTLYLAVIYANRRHAKRASRRSTS